jgi:hypothetical protein
MAVVIDSSSVPTTSFGSAQKVFDGMPCNQEAPAASVLHAIVSNMCWYPVSMEVMRQLFNPLWREEGAIVLGNKSSRRSDLVPILQ